jgi:hypothetical protein
MGCNDGGTGFDVAFVSPPPPSVRISDLNVRGEDMADGDIDNTGLLGVDGLCLESSSMVCFSVGDRGLFAS